MKSTAVVILNFNGLDLMKKYLNGVVESSPEGDVIVADNGSTDGSVEWLKTNFDHSRLILLDKNYGFAEGYNLALQRLYHKYEYFVLLNSDVRTPAGWLAPLVKHMDEHANCAACQPKILSEHRPDEFEYAGAAGGFIDSLGYPFCRGRIMSNVEKDLGQYDTTREIFWATGACLMIRASIYRETGGLDGRFFAHQEEIDLCWRIKSLGYSIVCIPQSSVFHVGGGSLGYESPFKTKLNFRNNALMLYKNLEHTRYKRVARTRLILDYIAAIQMFITGHKDNAKAVLQARKEFLSLKSEFEYNHLNIPLKARKKNLDCVLNRSLLLLVYIGRKHKFSQLEKHIKA